MREAAYAGVGKADLAERHAALARWAAPVRRPTHGRQPWAGSPPTTRGTTSWRRTPSGPPGSPTRSSLRPDAPARAVARSAWPRSAGRPAGRSPPASRPWPSSTPSAPPRWPATACRPPTGWCTPARCCSSAGSPTRWPYAEKIAAERRRRPGRPRRRAAAGRAGHRPLGDPARAYRLAGGAAGGHRGPTCPAQRAEAMRRLGMADFLARRLRQASSRFAAAYQVAVGAQRPRGAGVVAAEPGLGDHHPGRLRRRRRGAGPGGPAVRRAEATRSAGPGCAAPPRSPGCWPAGCARRAGWRRSFLPFGERVGEAWAVGTLRAVEAFAAAELGDLAEADREARRAYREFAAGRRRLGPWVRAGRPRRGRARPGRAGSTRRTCSPTPWRTRSAPGTRCCIGMAGTLRGFVASGHGRLERPRPTPARC